MKPVCSCRRRLLGGLTTFAALSALGPLAACGERGGDAQALAPLEIAPGTACELDGMILADYPGPKAQIHYAGVAAPAWTCDTVEMFNTLLRPEQVRAVAAVYVQDMGQAEWEHPRGHWIDAKTGVYVVGGKRHGSMGPTIGSFAREEDAKTFIAEWGGEMLRFDQVKPEMVDLSGGALHDTRM
jgi:copper chaperone NosL